MRTADTILYADPQDLHLDESIRQSHHTSTSGPWSRVLTAGSRLKTLPGFRSLTTDYLVIDSTSPQGSCVLIFSPGGMQQEGAIFFDPCSGTAYDAAGRVFKGTATGPGGGLPAKYNARTVHHHFDESGLLIIGVKGGFQSLPAYEFDHRSLFEGLTPTDGLIIAARYNDHEAISRFIEDGADPRYRSRNYGGPLMAAIIGSSSDIVRLLLELGAKAGSPELETATILGREDVVDLLKRNPDGS